MAMALTEDERKTADRLLAKLVGFACDEWANEVKRLMEAIETHMNDSLKLIQDDPKVRLSEADYKLWEVLNG
jgi:hypothetical protein